MKFWVGLILIAALSPQTFAKQCWYQIEDQEPVAMTEIKPGREWGVDFLVMKSESKPLTVLSNKRLRTFLGSTLLMLSATYKAESYSLTSCFGYCTRSEEVAHNISVSTIRLRLETSGGSHILNWVSDKTVNSSVANFNEAIEIPALGDQSVLTTSQVKIGCDAN